MGILLSGQAGDHRPLHVLKRNLKNKLRLEIAFEPGQAPPLPADLELHKLTATRWQIYLEQHQLGDVIAALDIDRLTDMKLSSATLEDLYFHYVEAV